MGVDEHCRRRGGSFPSWEGDGNVMQMGFYGERSLVGDDRARILSSLTGVSEPPPSPERRGIGQEAGSFLPKLNRKLDSH